MRNTYWKRMEKQNKKRKTAIHRNTNNVRIVVTREVIPSLSRRHNRGRKRRWSNGGKMHLPSLHTRNQTNGEKQKIKSWETNSEGKNIGAYDLTLNSLAKRPQHYYYIINITSYISSISFHSLLFFFLQWKYQMNVRTLGGVVRDSGIGQNHFL